MPYIGRPLNAGNLAVQSGTGDGSDTTPIATLDYSVGSSNSIGVYLDGVRQLAGTDFTASGTTLTFTTAPANGVGIDVYFLGLELSIPTPADATVAKAKITTTLINEHVDTVITASDSILFSDATDSNANKKDTVQGILDLAGVAGITSSANETAISIDANEIVSMPKQPLVLAFMSTTQSNVTGDGTLFSLTGSIWTEIFDQNDDFVDGTFTAPVTGRYLLCGTIQISGHLSGHTVNYSQFVASNRTSVMVYGHPYNAGGSNAHFKRSFSMIMDMDAADTVYMQTETSGSTKVCDILANNAWFSAALLG